MGKERGKGYAKDGLKCCLKHFFKQGMHRVDAEVYEFNKVSKGLLKDLGFKEEGVRRQAYSDNERFWDILVFGLLESEWSENILKSKKHL
jgi:RimJ/RimL family protein N-acetyltransferase